MKLFNYMPGLVVPALMAGISSANAEMVAGLDVNTPLTIVSIGEDEFLGDGAGMSLYTYRDDTRGVSNCYDECAASWQPFYADDNANPAGPFTLIERKDGAKQWAKDGMPLYYWTEDQQPGDKTGDGLGGMWDVARP